MLLQLNYIYARIGYSLQKNILKAKKTIKKRNNSMTSLTNFSLTGLLSQDTAQQNNEAKASKSFFGHICGRIGSRVENFLITSGTSFIDTTCHLGVGVLTLGTGAGLVGSAVNLFAGRKISPITVGGGLTNIARAAEHVVSFFFAPVVGFISPTALNKWVGRHINAEIQANKAREAAEILANETREAAEIQANETREAAKKKAREVEMDQILTDHMYDIYDDIEAIKEREIANKEKETANKVEIQKPTKTDPDLAFMDEIDEEMAIDAKFQAEYEQELALLKPFQEEQNRKEAAEKVTQYMKNMNTFMVDTAGVYA